MKILILIPTISIFLVGCAETAAKPLFAAPSPAQVTQRPALVEPIADAATAAADTAHSVQRRTLFAE